MPPSEHAPRSRRRAGQPSFLGGTRRYLPAHSRAPPRTRARARVRGRARGGADAGRHARQPSPQRGAAFSSGVSGAGRPRATLDRQSYRRNSWAGGQILRGESSMNLRRVLVLLLLCLIAPASAAAQEDTYNGSQLWLRYVPVTDAERYRASRRQRGRRERRGEPGLPPHPHPRRGGGRDGTARPIEPRGGPRGADARPLRAARDGGSGGRGAGATAPSSSARARAPPRCAAAIPASDLIASEGYVIRTVGSRTIIAGRTELGALYGTFAFLRLHPDGAADHGAERRRPRRRSSAVTSTTGTRNGCTPATTRRGPAASTARTAPSSTSPPPA